jgi:hypothetical protein
LARGNQMTTHKVLVGTLVLFACVSGRAVAQESWVGQSVMPIKNDKDIQFGDWINGRQVHFPFKTVFPIKVRDDREGWLRVSNGEREGWVDKADFILSRNGPATFHVRVLAANPKGEYAIYTRDGALIVKGELNKDVNETLQAWTRELARMTIPFVRRAR